MWNPPFTPWKKEEDKFIFTDTKKWLVVSVVGDGVGVMGKGGSQGTNFKL